MVDKEFLDDLAEQRAIEEIVEKGFAGRSSSSKWKRHLVVAAAALVFISVGAYAAVGGGFEFFRDELEAPFIDLVTAPLEPVYAEDQGIRFEVVGAERVNSVVLLYMTMQDVSGEDRLSMWHHPNIEIRVKDDQEISRGWSSRDLHFDHDTNTRYFELQVRVDVDTPLTDILEVSIERIRSNQNHQEEVVLPYVIGEWQMEVAVADTYHPALIWEGIDLPEREAPRVIDREARIDYMIVNPFGVHIVGSHKISFAFDVVIEVNNEPVEIWGSGCGIGSDGFECFFSVAEPLNIEEVTAVIFNDYRIEVPE